MLWEWYGVPVEDYEGKLCQLKCVSRKMLWEFSHQLRAKKQTFEGLREEGAANCSAICRALLK